MARAVTSEDVEAALAGAVPAHLTFQVERSEEMVFVTLPEQPGIPWEIHVGWEGVPGEGDHLLSIFSEPLKYEELYLEDVDEQVLQEFKLFIGDLLSGRITIELTRFRATGKLWRTRLLDPRKPEGEQVVYRYYRRPFRWWRPTVTELVLLDGTRAAS
jgi:hypothetical protein